MGNPQERLIWLAGFLDGEGHIGIVEQISKRKNGKKYHQFKPRIILTNTDTVTLNVVEDTLAKNDCAYYISWNDPEKRERGNLWVWHLEISGIKRVKRFLDKVLPYLITKAPQATVMYDWLKHRLERPNVSNGVKIGKQGECFYCQKKLDNQKATSCRTCWAKHTQAGHYNEEDAKVKTIISKLNRYPQRPYVEHKSKWVRDSHTKIREDMV